MDRTASTSDRLVSKQHNIVCGKISKLKSVFSLDVCLRVCVGVFVFKF